MAAVASSAQETAQSPARARTTAHIADRATYWLIIAGTYFTYGFLFYYAAKSKVFDDAGTMPAGLAKSFNRSLIASFPGVNASWLLLGLLELLVAVAVAASVISGEFLPSRGKPILLSSLGLSMFAFAMMAFAENMIGGFSTVAELFAYFSGTAVVIILVLLMPPYRPTGWLASLTQR